MVGVEVGKSSIEKIFHPEPVEFSIVAIIGLAASIGVKLWMAYFNQKLGRKIGSAAMEATAVDSRSDAISTTATLISVVAAAFTTLPIDGVMGTIVSVMILLAGYGAAKDTLSPLLGQKPDEELVKNLEKMMMSYEGVLGIHDLIVHDYGPSRRFASLHAEVPVNQDIMLSHDIIDTAEREIGKALNLELVIHMDPIETDNELTNEMRQIVLQNVREINPEFNIHDFRMVHGGELTNLIFDITVPIETKMENAEIQAAIEQKMKEINPNYFTVTLVDRVYC